MTRSADGVVEVERVIAETLAVLEALGEREPRSKPCFLFCLFAIDLRPLVLVAGGKKRAASDFGGHMQMVRRLQASRNRLTAMKERAARPGDDLSVQVERAKRRLEEAVAAASAAEKRTAAEIRALEADLEKERLRAAEAVEEARADHADELRREREAKEQAIAAAQGRLAEIETHAEAAERRIEEAERRAAEAEGAIADAGAQAREAAAAWLRGQVESIRREAGRR
jgi:chromosome segregation ATPase